ncbi:hypothetical protein LJR232_005144 [Aquipseudomonas alcaligenes]
MEYKINFGIDASELQLLEKQEYKIVTFQKPGSTHNPAWCVLTPPAPHTWIDFDAGYNLYKGYKTGEGLVPVQVDTSELGPSPHEALPLTERDGLGKDKVD